MQTYAALEQYHPPAVLVRDSAVGPMGHRLESTGHCLVERLCVKPVQPALVERLRVKPALVGRVGMQKKALELGSGGGSTCR